VKKKKRKEKFNYREAAGRFFGPTAGRGENWRRWGSRGGTMKPCGRWAWWRRAFGNIENVARHRLRPGTPGAFWGTGPDGRQPPPFGLATRAGELLDGTRGRCDRKDVVADGRGGEPTPLRCARCGGGLTALAVPRALYTDKKKHLYFGPSTHVGREQLADEEP